MISDSVTMSLDQSFVYLGERLVGMEDLDDSFKLFVHLIWLKKREQRVKVWFTITNSELRKHNDT